jgi:hypothetical protein
VGERESGLLKESCSKKTKERRIKVSPRQKRDGEGKRERKKRQETRVRNYLDVESPIKF